MKEADDNRRSGPGLVVSVRDLDNGQVRLILDDASMEDGSGRRWRKDFLFTWTEVEKSAFDLRDASDDFYRELGRMVALRLSARRATTKDERDDGE